MDNSEGGDDQGAGWLLVKKKHRSSSKLSVHGWVGGLSAKQKSSNPHRQPSLGVKLANNNYSGQTSKASSDNIVFDPGVSAEDFNIKAVDIQKLPQGFDDNQSKIKKSDVLPKIKWGDLDDRTLLLHQGKTTGEDIKFGRIESPHLVCPKSEEANDFISHSPSKQKEDKFVATAVDEDHPLQASNSVLPRNNCKEANEISLQEAKVQITNEKSFDPNASVLSCSGNSVNKEADTSSPSEESSCANADMHLRHAVICETGRSDVSESPVEVNSKMVGLTPDSVSLHPDEGVSGATSGMSGEEIPPAVTKEAVMIQAPETYERVCPEVSEVSIVHRDSDMVVSTQDSQLKLPYEIGTGTLAKSSISDSMEDFECREGDVVLHLKKTQIMDHANANGDESKERFRERLWCFLFENLNRAVDELYLLCELECDLEQMKEAILVLEEAAFDFTELTARVEEFEKVKKSSPNMIEGAALTIKSDHRRPHALSWEVFNHAVWIEKFVFCEVK